MLSYSELRDIQRREMESSAIVVLVDGFYQSMAEFLAKKKSEAVASKSLLAIKEYENIRRILLSIQVKREEKIVLMALRGDNAGAGLTNEERELLKELVSIINRSRDIVKSAWDHEEMASAHGNAEGVRRIKILQDVAQYKGLDNVVYGPFKHGEEQAMPNAEAEWLLKARMAEPL